MKAKIIKKHNKLLSFFLSLLGFGSVLTFNSCEDEVSPSSCEYGTPYATFNVKGTVKSETTSNTIPNIRVVMGYDTTFTAEDGSFQVSTSEFPDDQTFTVSFKDIDGVNNGSLQPMDTTIEFTDPEFTDGDDSWYSGETEKEIDIELKNEE